MGQHFGAQQSVSQISQHLDRDQVPISDVHFQSCAFVKYYYLARIATSTSYSRG